MGDGTYPGRGEELTYVRPCVRCRELKNPSEFPAVDRKSRSWGLCAPCVAATMPATSISRLSDPGKRAPRGPRKSRFDAAPLPQRHGRRVLVSPEIHMVHGKSKKWRRKVQVLCEPCGVVRLLSVHCWRHGNVGPLCLSCSGKLHIKGVKSPGRPRGIVEALSTRKRWRTLRHQTFETVPYHLDTETQDFIAQHPGGAELSAVGEFLGVTRQRVQQIEVLALRTLRSRLEELGLSREDLEESIGLMCQRGRGRVAVADYEPATLESES